ncbi:expressed unknown protein [Seminavis robusta]|uniref:Uncharacterized protein n=1 Tax=Seminavis robusta TaxID=568900 RepID=A0A9N8HS49_9STRA|nr:expressed unknown protein [Seminavis robusta]|eukprot:Sro1476_g275960.1 n/a (292) ;mRNA; f:25554-26429
MNNNSSSTTELQQRRRTSNRSTKNRLSTGGYWAPLMQEIRKPGGVGLAKCTKRLLDAPYDETRGLHASQLALAIKSSSRDADSATKEREEQRLVKYTQALLTRNIDPNDTDSTGQSAVSWAASFDFQKLLNLLLELGCSLKLGTIHPLRAAVNDNQHECMTILLEKRGEECQAILRQEEKMDSWEGSWGGMSLELHAYNTLSKAVSEAALSEDVRAVALLRDQGKAGISDLFWSRYKAELDSVLQVMYGEETDVSAWSRDLHWSFPTMDRTMINYLWHLWARKKNDFPSGS